MDPIANSSRFAHPPRPALWHRRLRCVVHYYSELWHSDAGPASCNTLWQPWRQYTEVGGRLRTCRWTQGLPRFELDWVGRDLGLVVVACPPKIRGGVRIRSESL